MENNLFWAVSGPNSELHHNLYTAVNLGPGSPISTWFNASTFHRLNSGQAFSYASMVTVDGVMLAHMRCTIQLPLGPQVALDRCL